MEDVAWDTAKGEAGLHTNLVANPMNGLGDIDQKSIKINNIRVLRERRGWTQDELASRAETSQQQIDRLEKGERQLTWVWMRRLAVALSCHPMDLVDWP